EHHGTRRLGEGEQLTHRVLRLLRVPLGIDADEDDLLQAQLPVLDFRDVFQLRREAGNSAQGLAVVTIQLVTIYRVVLAAVTPLQRLRCTGTENGIARRPRSPVGENAVDDVQTFAVFW